MQLVNLTHENAVKDRQAIFMVSQVNIMSGYVTELAAYSERDAPRQTVSAVSSR
jgi:hypothetical protein